MKSVLLKKNVCVFSVIVILVLSGGCTDQKADLVIQKARIVTMNPDQPEVQAVAVTGDRIVAAGTEADISGYIGPGTRIIEPGEGSLVTPGLIESHAHFMSLGYSKLNLDLTRTRSFRDLVDSVAAVVNRSEKGEWIVGRGWHQERWTPRPEPLIDGYPVHEALSAISPENPVYLTHASGHAVLVNRRAMELSSLTAQTKDPDGGTILRYENSNPTGILLESAADVVYKRLAYDQRETDPSARMRKAFGKAVQTCLENGITTFHDAGVSFAMVDFFKEMLEEGELGIRLYVMINESNPALEERLSDYRLIGLGNHHLTVRSLKRFIDGALGAHGAWFYEPYEDMPKSHGLVLTPPEELRRTAELAMMHGFQLCTHAIGDRGNREILDIYQQAFEENPEKTDLRWRVEHAQHLTEQDIPRFAGLGVIASMQTNHCTSDGPWVVKRLGEKRAEEGAYVWRKLMQAGALIANGTDAPVESVDPAANFYSAVTRRAADGRVFYPGQCMTRTEALQSYTINGARAGFEEDLKGSIETGKLADFTVFSADILTIPEEEIPLADILHTIVNGEVRYSATQ